MTFPNTVTFTIAAVARVLNRVNQDDYGSEYQYNGAIESINLKIRHSTDSIDKSTGFAMKRHNVFVEHVVFATPTAFMTVQTYTVTLRHKDLADPTPSVDLGKAVNVWLATATNLADIGAGNN